MQKVEKDQRQSMLGICIIKKGKKELLINAVLEDKCPCSKCQLNYLHSINGLYKCQVCQGRWEIKYRQCDKVRKRDRKCRGKNGKKEVCLQVGSWAAPLWGRPNKYCLGTHIVHPSLLNPLMHSPFAVFISYKKADSFPEQAWPLICVF